MRERVSVVNDNDEEISVKYRDELLPSDIHRIVSIWITDGEDNILLAQRALHKALHPGFWGPAAAGAVSYGESYEEAAYKEMAEEIDLTDVRLTFIKKVIFIPNGEKRFISWYSAKCDKPEEAFILEKDVAKVAWIRRDKLIEDLAANPEKYVPSRALWADLFLS